MLYNSLFHLENWIEILYGSFPSSKASFTEFLSPSSRFQLRLFFSTKKEIRSKSDFFFNLFRFFSSL